MRTLDRWRCYWTWPPGHSYEVISYFDGVAGRWAALGRCACCDTLRGLAIGDPMHGAVFANNPLATGLSNQGTKRSAPPSASPTTGHPSDGDGFADVALGDGVRVYVRRAQVSRGARRKRHVYVAHVVGADGPRSASPNLRRAVARALREPRRSARLEKILRQLEHELA